MLAVGMQCHAEVQRDHIMIMLRAHIAEQTPGMNNSLVKPKR